MLRDRFSYDSRMPFIGEIELEFCDVETKAATRDDVIQAVHTQPRDVRDWFLTLRRPDENYMDATMEDEKTFSVRYSDHGQTYASAGAIDEVLLESLLLSFYDNDRAWKTLCAWNEIVKKKPFSLKNLFS